MTNRPFALSAHDFDPKTPAEVSQARITTVVVLAMALILAVAGTVIRTEAPAAIDAEPKPVTAPVPAARLASLDAQSISRDTWTDIEALAGLVAKKYRVAPEATRGLIATIYREGRRIGLDPLLIVAVIAVESRFNPIAQSASGAQGLMQVIPQYHRESIAPSQADSLLEPHANIRLGARVLKEYIRKGGNEAAGLQLYNGSTDDATNAYATKVLGEKQRLQQVLKRRA